MYNSHPESHSEEASRKLKTIPDGKSAASARPLHADDIPILHANCWPNMPERSVRDKLASTLSRERASRVWPCAGLYRGSPVGFGQLARWRETVEISDLVVGAAWRSQGVGTALIQYMLAIARQQGFPRVEVGVAVANTRAAALYRRLGFTHLERRLMLDLGSGPEQVLYLSQSLP